MGFCLRFCLFDPVLWQGLLLAAICRGPPGPVPAQGKGVIPTPGGVRAEVTSSEG